MKRPFTDNERSMMVRLHHKNSSNMVPPGEQLSAIDALRLRRSAAGAVYLRAYLQTVGIPLETGSVLAWVVSPGKGGAWRLRRIPLDEVVWLFHAPNPPASQARLLDPEPLLSLPGEAEARPAGRTRTMQPHLGWAARPGGTPHRQGAPTDLRGPWVQGPWHPSERSQVLISGTRKLGEVAVHGHDLNRCGSRWEGAYPS